MSHLDCQGRRRVSNKTARYFKQKLFWTWFRIAKAAAFRRLAAQPIKFPLGKEFFSFQVQEFDLFAAALEHARRTG